MVAGESDVDAREDGVSFEVLSLLLSLSTTLLFMKVGQVCLLLSAIQVIIRHVQYVFLE